jgi:hypothetical protein
MNEEHAKKRKMQLEILTLRNLLHDAHSALLMVHVAPHGQNYLKWIAGIIDNNQKYFAGEAGQIKKASLPDFSEGKEAGLPAAEDP